VLHPSQKRRVAGVSSFGFSGTNAHVLIEEYLPAIPEAHESETKSPWMVTVSAQSEEALDAAQYKLSQYSASIRIPLSMTSVRP